MNLRYFQAPLSEMSGLSRMPEPCDLCGRTDRCFDLARVLGPETLLPATRGCLLCLSDRRFGIFHITVVGYLDENGLTWCGDPPMTPSRIFAASESGVQEQSVIPVPDLPPVPNDAAIAELRATPTFSTWNEVPWPVYCNDFMVFLGSWQPKDVIAQASAVGASPEEFFFGIVEPHDRPLWDGSTEWGVHFVVFRCTTCTQHRGIIDLD